MRSFGRMALVAAAAGILATAGGCASIRDHRGYLADTALLDSVQPGIDNRVSIEKSLGRPTFVSQFGEKDWYYVSVNTKQNAFARAKTSDQIVVRVRFDAAGNVVGVDRKGMEQVVNLDPDNHATPTLGRSRSFLEDLFGNIGAVGAPGATPGAGGPGPNGS